VLREGRRHRHRILSLGLKPNGLPYNRYGYAIGKRVGAAVVRNRVRRRLREVIRALTLAPGYDIVLTAGEASAAATFDQLRQAVQFCADRAGVLRPTPTMLAKPVETS
jgi:ribonuclease P protein component